MNPSPPSWALAMNSDVQFAGAVDFKIMRKIQRALALNPDLQFAGAVDFKIILLSQLGRAAEAEEIERRQDEQSGS